MRSESGFWMAANGPQIRKKTLTSQNYRLPQIGVKPIVKLIRIKLIEILF